MIEFEEFKNNIKLTDRFDVNHITVNNNITFTSHHEKTLNESPNGIKSQPLAAAVLGLHNTGIPLPSKLDFHNCWTDMDAQEAYLNQKPKTYMILGKQGTGIYSLGESLSKKLNCIHLCPKNVLLDEIDQQSPAGKCLDFNMRSNKVCKFDSILKILKRKLKSPVIQHRGFIISGFPLVTSSRDIKYFTNSLIGEESILVVEDILNDLILNFKKKKSRKTRSSPSSMSSDNFEMPEEGKVEEEEEAEQEPELDEETEEQVVELPKFLLDSCSDVIYPSKMSCKTKKSVLLQQLFDVFEFKPDIIIYVTCPNADVITKKNRKYLNYLNSSNTFNTFGDQYFNDTRWPSSYIMTEYKKPFDTHVFNPKYNCTQPINFRKNSTDQLCNFKITVTSFIEEKLKEIDPRYVIKLDGRVSVHEMINNTIEVLQVMPIKPVIIPIPLYLEEPLEMDEFWPKVEELNVIQSGTIKFNRYASPWYNRCPVELKKRQSIQGNSKFAVSFFKHIYLLSSLDAMVSFCHNPRTYLKLEYLEPTCRVIILGTKSSGKTMISKCLSWLFNCPVICFKTLLQNEKLKKYDKYAKTILSEIIANIEDARFAQWQNLELERISNLNTWFNTVSSTLSSYVSLLVKNLKEESQDIVLLNKLNVLKNQLSFLPLDDIDECKNLLKDEQLLKYAPASLTVEANKPEIPVLGDEDVTQGITNYIAINELEKEIEPTPEELVSEIINVIQFDSKSEISKEHPFGKFIIDGFPSNPDYWSYLIEYKVLPDYTIALIENRDIDADLVQRYVDIETHIKSYHERYLLANDVLVKTKLLQDKPDTTLLDIEIIKEEILKSTFDFIFAFEGKSNKDFDTVTFTEHMERFREDWGIIKQKLEENHKVFIEIDLENKSDIEIIDEILLKIRKGYVKPSLSNEEESETRDDENEIPKNDLTYNDSRFLGEVDIYCPVAFYDYGVLREGKPEFSATHDNKLYYFSNDSCREILLYDLTKYLSYNKPFKNIPPLRICVIGCIGSGKTEVSKMLAKELGLMHIDFEEFVNNFLIPRHFNKVGWKYENSFTDNLIDDEEVVEFQIDEENFNVYSDILYNEQELRKLVSNYFERGSPLLSVLMQNLIKKLWFESPFNKSGVIIDGYPKLPADVEDMINCFCIPDVILELEGSLDTTLNRLSPVKLMNWKLQLNEAKNKAKMKLAVEKNDWQNFVTQNVVIKLIIDEILENIAQIIDEPVTENLSTQVSTIMDADPLGLSNIDVNLFKTYNEFIQENPEPVDRSQWEKADDVLEKINNRLESIYEVDDENIQNLKEMAEEQKMKLISLNGKQALYKVYRRSMSKLSKFRNRSESFFEQTFIINCDIAEMLLLEGFFLLSKFHRCCPVFIMENPQAIINSYNINKRKNKIFPIIHRAYIYFISSEENVSKFRLNPLKYIQGDNIINFKSYTLRIGVIGPPKSGKSKLAAKLAKKYGLICISRGMAIRHVLEHMYWTVLGLKMITSLSKGEIIDTELIVKAVVTVAMDYRTITNGFVLDGFPETPHEVHEFTENGLFPFIMFDLHTDKEMVLRNSQNEIHYSILKTKPVYSQSFIEYRYGKWRDKCARVRDWINEDTRNLYVINGNNSKWQCFTDACVKIEYIIPKIHKYLMHTKTEVVPLDVMCISKNTFLKRMSCYKNLCPVCFHKNTLRHSGFPPYNEGLIQYEDCFYWVCADHYSLVSQYPQIYLRHKEITIPEIPAVVKLVNPSLVYENGICIVTYAENLPSQKIVRGDNVFAAAYKKMTYLFCSTECLNKFLMKPHMYYDIKIFKEMSIFPKLTLNKLPHIGYLEQTVGNTMTEACCAVNEFRPKYPGLSKSLSALLYIALYLKTHNSNLDKSMTSRYSKIFKVFEARCKLTVELGLRMRSMDNPFAKYPKCCDPNRVKYINSITLRKSSTVISSSLPSLHFEAD